MLEPCHWAERHVLRGRHCRSHFEEAAWPSKGCASLPHPAGCIDCQRESLAAPAEQSPWHEMHRIPGNSPTENNPSLYRHPTTSFVSTPCPGRDFSNPWETLCNFLPLTRMFLVSDMHWYLSPFYFPPCWESNFLEFIFSYCYKNHTGL